MSEEKKVEQDERGASKKPMPAVGETWHVRFPDASALATMEIREISAGTVVLGAPNSLSHSRYEFHEIAFVEQARAASTSANVAQKELQVRGRMRLKVEKLAGALTEAEKTKSDIIGDDGEQVTGVSVGWGAWALLRAAIIDLIEYKCESDSALADAHSANVAQGAEAVVDALEETQGLLVAMLHEKRPTQEIEQQIGDNRTALQAFASAAPPAQTALTDEQITDIRRAAVLIRENSYPFPDKPHSNWALADRIDKIISGDKS